MKELTTDEIKKIQLDILSCIDKFCNENNIKYSLGYGTLLGAVRHKGYIPWDDDVDLWMLREDYELFKKKFLDQKTASYSIGCLGAPKDWYLSFVKVFDTSTIVVHDGAITPNMGVFVDVFPLDNISINEKAYIRDKRYRTILRTMQNVKVSKFSNNIIKNIILFFLKIIVLPFSPQTLGNKIEKSAYKSTITDYVHDSVMDIMKRPIEKSVFEKMKLYEFEGSYYMGVENADLVLKSLYSDYWKLPPIEQRVPKHGLRIYLK